jgi:maltoporin
VTRPTTPPHRRAVAPPGPRPGAERDAAPEGPAGTTGSASDTVGAPEGKNGEKDEEKKKTDGAAWWRGFGFGSYGRVGAATDERGSPGRQLNLAAHGPRLGERSYVETDLYYRLKPIGGVKLRTVLTLAFKEDLFHYTGDFDSVLAIRNLYLEANDLFVEGLGVWMGSRMYRGDDIYLLDFWPLDHLNTVGGGVHYRYEKFWVAWQIGTNRLRDQYQYQEVLVPGLHNTSETVVLLNRQRMITSLKAVQRFGGDDGRFGAKIKLYAELHTISPGTLDAHLPEAEQEQLHSDYGYLVGLQLGIWNFGPRSHLNLFVRWAQGLAAYGEFAIPFGLDRDKLARDAREFLLALSGNWELKRWFGIQVGGYVRYFRDADPNRYDWDDGWEYVGVMRPHLFLHDNFALALELSYQGRSPAGLNPWTAEAQNPGILKFSILPLLTFGKGTYARPQFRLIYTVMRQNEGARMSWNPLDPRRDMKVGHYLGLQAEWWFNSTYR